MDAIAFILIVAGVLVFLCFLPAVLSSQISREEREKEERNKHHETL